MLELTCFPSLAAHSLTHARERRFVENNFSRQALLLSPTYELALQTGKVVEEMSKYYPNFKVHSYFYSESILCPFSFNKNHFITLSPIYN